MATVKAGALIFARIGAGTTASGQPLPGVQITRASGDQRRYSVADREKYTGVRAYWGDRKAARRTVVLVGTADNEKKLQATYATAEEARQHAEAELQRVERGTTTLTISLAVGRPDVYPEQSVNVSGFKPEINSDDGLVSKVAHTITSDGGVTTKLEMERVAAGHSRQ